MWAMSYGCSTITFSQLKQKTALGPIIVKESDIFPIIEKPPLCVVPLCVIGSVSGHFSSFFIFTIFRLIHNLVQQSAPFLLHTGYEYWLTVPGARLTWWIHSGDFVSQRLLDWPDQSCVRLHVWCLHIIWFPTHLWQRRSVIYYM